MVGALAQILAFTQQKTTAASSSGNDGTFLMVAGACNHWSRLFSVMGLESVGY